ncbi:hypothetical protein EZV62_025187 [Acer yangbiense]|uniref:Uncharacterized protein n=1 Tax=Acer yangbiense TaxID=1000413 RepID=A0A5C7GYB3_9ROSI|nr:hypothetical protein EZV62_025187 [Acer yangbiense]
MRSSFLKENKMQSSPIRALAPTMQNLSLVFSYKLAEKAVIDVLITFFADPDSELKHEPKRHSLRYAIVYDLKYAIAFVNSLEGLTALMLIFLIYINEAFGGGHLKRIIFCLVVAYACGLTILAIASSHVFSESYIDSLIIIIGVIIVAVGRAGLKPFVEEFTDEQLEAHEPDRQDINEKRVQARRKKWHLFASVAGSLVAIPIYKISWNPRLITTGWVMGITFVLFCLATPLYHKEDQAAATSTRIAEEPFTSFTCIRVLWAALLKRREPYPFSTDHFFCLNNDGFFLNNNDELELWPQAKLLRWIDKAAIIEGHEEQENAGRLCSVTMVQETKYILKMVPMWSAFLVFGLVLSAGNTFYALQGIYLESADVLLVYLFLLRTIAREMVSNDLSPLCLLSKWFPEAKLKRNMMRIWGGMVISILCSAVAWWVEVRRLDIFENEYRDWMYSIPMSIWWLAPQFFLLGLMEGLAMDGLEELTIDDDHLSRSMKKFLKAINDFIVYGIGSALNILCINSNMKLFLDTLNESRLDLYYKHLTIYGTTLNCVYLLFISIVIYRDRMQHK